MCFSLKNKGTALAADLSRYIWGIPLASSALVFPKLICESTLAPNSSSCRVDWPHGKDGNGPVRSGTWGLKGVSLGALIIQALIVFNVSMQTVECSNMGTTRRFPSLLLLLICRAYNDSMNAWDGWIDDQQTLSRQSPHSPPRREAQRRDIANRYNIPCQK